MNRFGVLVLLILTFSLTGFARESQLEKATNVVNEIMSAPDKGIPHDLLDKAVCVGIVPSEIKGAFVVGGTYGRGVLVCRRHGSWGAPSMFTLGGGSFGFQIGGEATDVVFIVMNVARRAKAGPGQCQARWRPVRSSRTCGAFGGRRHRCAASRRNPQLLAHARFVCRGVA